MKQITKPIAVETHSEAEHADVLRRLESMGFKHARDYTHSSMIKSWKEYPLLDICNYNERTYTRNASPDCFVYLIPASQFLAEYGTEKTEASAAAPPSRQITSLLTIQTHTKDGFVAVIKRLISMGWTNAVSGSNVDEMANNWSQWPHITIENQDRINNRTFNRFSDYYPPLEKLPLLSVDQFLSEYGPVAPSAATPPSPRNPANFVVSTERSETLSRIVQELAFSMGILWANGDKCVRNVASPYLYMIRREFSYPFESKGIRHSDSPYPTEPADQWPLYSAATQMGEIVRLLSTPVVSSAPPPKPPEIHGYKAVYTAGAPTVNFGCAQIGKNVLRDAAKLMGCVINNDGSVMRDAGIVPEQGCNRSVESITLDSGKTLSRTQIKEILGYIAAVDEHAKKYPEKS